MSPSVWREWIEIIVDTAEVTTWYRLPPCGGSGLKYDYDTKAGVGSSLPPCGGSGLKWDTVQPYFEAIWSPSVWREWIEIPRLTTILKMCAVSLLSLIHI